MRKGKKVQKRLQQRQHDYTIMINQPKIGDGHRGPEAYKKPGSNKK